MDIFIIKSINKLGDYDDEWGQTFWAHVEEQAMPVKFTKQIKYVPAVGSKIVAEEHKIKPGKNGEFMQLSKVKLSDSGTSAEAPPTFNPAPPSDLMKMLELIREDISEIKQRVIRLEGAVEPSPEEVPFD